MKKIINNFQQDWPTFKGLYLDKKFRKEGINKQPISIGFYREKEMSINEKKYILKIIEITSESLIGPFEAYLKDLCDYQNLDQISYLFRIMAFSFENSCFYIIQKIHNRTIQENNVKEINALRILRAVVKLYCILSEKTEIFQILNKFNVMGPCFQTVFFYYSYERRNKLSRGKVKVDFLKFNEKPQKNVPYEITHLKEFGLFMKNMLIPGEKIGICTRTVLNRIMNDKKCTWKRIFENPIFCQDKFMTPNTDYWKIEKSDRLFLKQEEEKKEFEERKSYKFENHNRISPSKMNSFIREIESPKSVIFERKRSKSVSGKLQKHINPEFPLKIYRAYKQNFDKNKEEKYDELGGFLFSALQKIKNIKIKNEHYSCLIENFKQSTKKKNVDRFTRLAKLFELFTSEKELESFIEILIHLDIIEEDENL